MTYSLNDDPVCPHCDHVMKNVLDLELFRDDESTETDCGECGKTFIVICHLQSPMYSTRKPKEKP